MKIVNEHVHLDLKFESLVLDTHYKPILNIQYTVKGVSRYLEINVCSWMQRISCVFSKIENISRKNRKYFEKKQTYFEKNTKIFREKTKKIGEKKLIFHPDPDSNSGPRAVKPPF